MWHHISQLPRNRKSLIHACSNFAKWYTLKHAVVEIFCDVTKGTIPFFVISPSLATVPLCLFLFCFLSKYVEENIRFII